MQGFGHLLRKHGSRSAVQINGKGGKVIVQILHRNGLSRVVAGQQQTKENLVAAATNCPSAFESVVSLSHSARPAPLPPCSSTQIRTSRRQKRTVSSSFRCSSCRCCCCCWNPTRARIASTGEKNRHHPCESCGCRAWAPHRWAARCHTNTSKENFVSSLLMLTNSSYYYYYQLAYLPAIDHRIQHSQPDGYRSLVWAKVEKTKENGEI